ncbi:hypothetical protein KHA93_19805 [Bacillus sp. FJAT-49732]|uniref:Uncharacterized protein n=1 Tax=Lederbergia citrisecunda TaxID=2833583 RepID=A0A942TU90_9BACI|nr:hypothetical protein [Lederbergia citrisecunda]MBS4201854.1 hypothetical protein [Lederbergia citrisecunda]
MSCHVFQHEGYQQKMPMSFVLYQDVKVTTSYIHFVSLLHASMTQQQLYYDFVNGQLILYWYSLTFLYRKFNWNARSE